jgi:hypothetical protein
VSICSQCSQQHPVKTYLANADDIRPQFQVSDQLTTDATGAFSSSISRDVPLPVNATSEDLDNIPLSSVQGFKQIALPWYADQCLPFDITIAAANEYGAAASAKLFGVEILNEGFGTSVDDSVLEQQGTFIARSVLPLQAVMEVLRPAKDGSLPSDICGANTNARTGESPLLTFRLHL